MLFPLILVPCEEKKQKCFYNNLGIYALIIYFCFVLIDLINDYKNIFPHNVHLMVFDKNCLYNGFLYKLLACYGFSYELFV